MPKKKITRTTPLESLPEDYVVCYRENRRWGFIYRKDTRSKILKFSDVIFKTRKECEAEAYDWMFSNDTFFDPRRSIELEKMLFLHEASIH